MFDIMRLALASWETIAYRTAMMADGTCSLSEYYSMVAEKVTAGQLSLLALAAGQGGEAVLAPYLTAATANSKRLRQR